MNTESLIVEFPETLYCYSLTRNCIEEYKFSEIIQEDNKLAIYLHDATPLASLKDEVWVWKKDIKDEWYITPEAAAEGLKNHLLGMLEEGPEIIPYKGEKNND